MMNALDYHGNTPLLKCAMQDSRDTVRKLLSSKAAIERHLLDLSVENMYKRNVLHYLVLNRDKHNIRLFLNILEDAKDALNAEDCYNMSPLKYCLTKEYEEEAFIIINHPKAKLKLKEDNMKSQGKTPLPEDVINEFAKLNKNKTRKKCVPTPELPQEEQEKAPSFQDQMNAIYQQSRESEKKRNDQRIEAEQKMAKEKEALKQKQKEEREKEIEREMANVKAKEEKAAEVKKIVKDEKAEIVNGADEGPSLEEIRASWKKNRRKERKEPKLEDFSLDTVMNDIFKKAEEKVTETKAEPEDQYITDSMNEEIQWALEQKKQQQQEVKLESTFNNEINQSQSNGTEEHKNNINLDIFAKESILQW